MKILGIDPGFERVGWGLIDTSGGDAAYHSCGVIKTSKDLPHQERLRVISTSLKQLIRKELPEVAVVEKLFFAKNKTTALKVAEARGVILLTLHNELIPIQQFTPLEVKLAVAGHGRAEKKQVEWVVKNVLKIKEDITSDDAMDALALCLMGQGGGPNSYPQA
jgi:crossover junction endodeoxyribonuclease RuvC